MLLNITEELKFPPEKKRKINKEKESSKEKEDAKDATPESDTRVTRTKGSKGKGQTPKGKGKSKDDSKSKSKADKLAMANEDLPVDFAMERRAARVVAEEAMKYSGESGRCPLPGCDSKGEYCLLLQDSTSIQLLI